VSALQFKVIWHRTVYWFARKQSKKVTQLNVTEYIKQEKKPTQIKRNVVKRNGTTL
jgi:hypothetical protein